MCEQNNGITEPFTLKEFIESHKEYRCYTLYGLLKKEKDKLHKSDKVFTRKEFSKCYQRCAERAAILLFAYRHKTQKNINFNISYESGCGLAIFSQNHDVPIGKETSVDGDDCKLLDFHRFNVIAEVVEEVLWHFCKKSVAPNLLLSEHGGTGQSMELSPTPNIKILSTDFFRTTIKKLAPESAETKSIEEWTFKSAKDGSFGWNLGERWNEKHTSEPDNNPPRSFLTFREFTDSTDGCIFLVSKKGLKKYNENECYSPLISSDQLKASFKCYVDHKIDLLGNEEYALCICCGARFSHEDLGSGHAPREYDELLGVFMTLIVDEVEEGVLKDITNNIYLSSGTVKYMLLRNLAREKSYKQQQDQNELKKQAQMLRLLEEPLSSLTKALEQTQQDTQMLRSILYDPHKSLFSVAPLVSDYFEEDRWCSYGKVRWKGIHKPSSLGTVEERHAAASVVAAIICRLFGAVPKGDEEEQDIYGKVVAMLESYDPAFEDLRKVLDIVLYGDSNKDLFFSELRSCLLSSAAIGNPSCVKKALKNLKLYVFTPFKYNGDAPIGPMALVLYDYGYRGEVYSSTDVENLLRYPIKGKKALFEQNSLPVPRYSDILSLVSGILAYAKNDKKEEPKAVKLLPPGNENTPRILLSFRKEIFDMSEIKETLQLMKTVAENHSLRSPQGNFRKPLLDFASMIYDSGKVDVKCRNGLAIFSIKCPKHRTRLVFKSHSFCIDIKGDAAS